MRIEVGPGHRRSHRNSALGFCCTSLNYAAANIVRFVLRKRFVDFSTDPQPMQQHRQFASRRNDGPFLSLLAAALGQLQTPSSQIAVSSKRAEDVVRSLHQQGSQIRDRPLC